MNKTLTVNIGGLVFHIEELAYHKLDQYLKAIRSSISIEEQDEVIHDIEIRIAELFSENITSSNQVVTIADVDRLIKIMGRPEDYRLNDDDETTTSHTQYVYTKQPKLYRDTQKGLIGGVLAGLGHYFKLDVVWIRIIFLVLLFFYGTGVLLYIIMWAIIPAARTSSEILEMQGVPININTIEQKVKENIEYVTNKFSDMDTEAIKKQMASSGTQAGKILQKFAGIFFIITALFGLLGTSIASIAISINTASINRVNNDFLPSIINATYPTWLFVSILSLVMILPFIGLLLIGLRLIYTNIKYALATLISLFVLWIISIVMLSIPFMKAKTYEDLGNLSFENIAIEHFADKIDITDDFNLDPQYKEIKIIAVTPAFFDTEKTNAIPYLIADTTAIKNSSFEILPTYQDEIYGQVEFKFENNKENKNPITFSTLDNFFDVEKNILYVAVDLENAEQKERKLHYTIYLPKTTKIMFHNQYETIISNLDKGVNKKTWYTMNGDNVLIQAELH